MVWFAKRKKTHELGEAFEPGSYVVDYGLKKPRLIDLMIYQPEKYSPREKLTRAFESAGVEGARFMGTDNLGVVNCNLTSQKQIEALKGAGFDPQGGHCGGFSIA